MGKMGYESGKGLGKHGQGRVAPVELSRQKGRQGLGLSIPDLDTACQRWDPSLEVVQEREEVEWLVGPDISPPSAEELETWPREGRRTLDMATMTDFCDPHLLASVLSCKTVFDKMEGLDLMKARSRSNPFETIRKGIFQNRAAMKMANIDAVFDFMFTKPTDLHQNPVLTNDKLLFFADVCAGPGGFSEYVLWKRKWRAKGIGFTLRGENDFRLDQFKSGPPETFEPYYGGKDNGDVFDSDNIRDLTELVMKVTGPNMGVHFMMADGGFSVEGQENIQELLSKQLYLCQFLVALCIVRPQGHFLCKLFDVFSPFSVGLVYVMYRAFHQVSIFKPNTSRPANSERYIVCKWKREGTEDLRDYLFELNERLNSLGSDSPVDLNHCVPLHQLQGDTNFYDYIVTSNNKLGERQVVNLAKISAFYRDTALEEPRQFDLRQACLRHWNVPDKVFRPESLSIEDALKALLGNPKAQEFLKKGAGALAPQGLEKSFVSVHDWKYLVLGNPEKELTYFLGLGRKSVGRYQRGRGRWEVLNQFELSPGTLVLGEVVTEYMGQGRAPSKFTCLHVFDALALGFEDISSKQFSYRLEQCKLYCKALEKHRTPNYCPVRLIQPLDLEEIDKVFDSVHTHDLKGGPQMVVAVDNFFYPAKGLLFLRTTKEPWAAHRSRSTGHLYYFNRFTKNSEYDSNRPVESVVSFRDSMASSLTWWWEEGVGLLGEGRKPDVIHKDDLLQVIHQLSA